MDQWIRAEIGGNTQKIFCGPAVKEMVPVTVVYEVNINLPSQGRGNALGLDLSRRFFLLRETIIIHKYIYPLGLENCRDGSNERVSIFDESLLF